MARVNIYLPDELAAAGRRAGLNLSAVTQDAVRHRLAAGSTDAWLARLPKPSPPVAHDLAMAALDEAREDPATRHG